MCYRTVDSVSALEPEDAGRWIFCGSHAGQNAARHAASFRPAGIVFNDAGAGKDNAGIAGLALLDDYAIAAAAVDAFTACIGDGNQTLHHGIIAHVNTSAGRLGIRAGMPCKNLLSLLSLSQHKTL